MKGLEVLYRGTLKSCNYHCSYCPFSKHQSSGRELVRDREQWEHFVRTVEERAEVLRVRALMVVPYGEALIHPWYWEGLARLSALAGGEAVGAQTNLSFPVSESMECFRRNGGDPGKLHLWGTFHPEMVSIEAFCETCRQLLKEHVRLCVGAVGVPENLTCIRKLREELPGGLYLWINRMDGLRRAYTEEETEAFWEIDPYFLRELACVPSDPGMCYGRCFVEGDGKVRLCNISRASGQSWDGLWEERQGPKHMQIRAVCGRKYCSCYLAYGGRQDVMNQILFGPHPVFRIPRRPKAVFLDIEGTLIPEDGSGRAEVPGLTRAGLMGLHRDKIPLFFATTLPYEEAERRCRTIRQLFSGGIFAGGAHVVVETSEGRWEQVQALPGRCPEVLEEIRRLLSCRMRIYRAGGEVCKITMLRPVQAPWSPDDAAYVEHRLKEAGICKVRVFTEQNCLQVVSFEATKANGVRMICKRLQIALSETAAAGDSAEDEEMLRICGGAVGGA